MTGSVVFLDPKGPGLEVLRSARQRGFETIVLCSDPDLLDKAPEPYRSAVALVDHRIPVAGWADVLPILRLVDELRSRRPEPIKGVYFNTDACAVVGTRLRLHVGLPSVEPATMETILDKHSLRRKLREVGLSQLRNVLGQDTEGWQTWEMPGPAYFKPTHGAMSAYVRRCIDLADLQSARQQWRSRGTDEPLWVRSYLSSHGDHYHLEEAIDGELLSVEAISSEGGFRCLGLLSRILYSKNAVIEMGSCFPYPHPQHDKIVELVRQAHQLLGFCDGPSHTEVIVGTDGRIEIIDWNPRFVGADVLQSINHAYGIAIQEALLDWALGQPPKVEPRHQQFSCLQYILPPHRLAFHHLELPNTPEVKFGAVFKEPGTPVESVDRQTDYLGCYLTVMPTFSEAVARSHELRQAVRINGSLEGAF